MNMIFKILERYTAVYVDFSKALNSLKQINSKLYIAANVFNNTFYQKQITNHIEDCIIYRLKYDS